MNEPYKMIVFFAMLLVASLEHIEHIKFPFFTNLYAVACHLYITRVVGRHYKIRDIFVS